MAGTLGFQTAGFRTRDRSRLMGDSEAVAQELAVVLTWPGGYEAALDLARQMDRPGLELVLVKLVSQDMPEPEYWSEVNGRGWKLVSIANKFEEFDRVSDEFLAELQTALKHHAEGLALPAGRRVPIVATSGRSSETKTKDLTDDERRELLSALYRNPDDDGVR